MNRCLFVVATIATLLILSPRTPAVHARSATAFPMTITDDMGNTVRISRDPRRIVSLDPRDTETLFAVGDEKRVVGDGGQYDEGAAGITGDFTKAQWPSPWGRDYPVKSKTLPHIEGGYDATHPFDLETVEGLHPDLVLSLRTDLPTLQKMRELGLTVVVLDPANVKGILHDITLVGRITGHSKQAAVVVGRIEKQIAGVKRAVARVRVRPEVYYEIDATNPTEPYTAGPGTYMDEALKIAGARNVADSASTCSGKDCYPQLSLETLVHLNPAVILLGDAAYGTTVASVKTRPGWETIAAVQSGKIYPFDDELVSRAGPRIGIGIERLAKLIHPNALK